MNRLDTLLQANEKASISAFTDSLLLTQNANVSGVWLFGSKARGEATFDSDIDLLVVVLKVMPSVRWQIREIAADCSLEYDVLINTHILDKERWDSHVSFQSTLWREITRDGISLLERVSIS